MSSSNYPYAWCGLFLYCAEPSPTCTCCLPPLSLAPFRASPTMDAIMREHQASPLDLVLHVGDLAYADGRDKGWDEFMAMVEPLASEVPYMVRGGAPCVAAGEMEGGRGMQLLASGMRLYHASALAAPPPLPCLTLLSRTPNVAARSHFEAASSIASAHTQSSCLRHVAIVSPLPAPSAVLLACLSSP